MSPRIQELAQQATKDIMGVPTLDQQKFAELIIQECCDVVRYVDAVDIKRHFGVEE